MPDLSLAYGRADLPRLRDLLEQKTGLYIADEKLSRLAEPFQQLETIAGAEPAAIISAIEGGGADGDRYLQRLVAAVATNETYFFRTTAHFAALKDYLLPELIEKKKALGARALTIWSAGCSTGEEPYSIAILLLEHFPDILSWQIKILATDIDLDALEIAREGVYRPWSFRGVAPEIIRKYWRALDGDSLRVDDRVRSLITFGAHNLKTDPYPSPAEGVSDIDVIFCRNVTIYFRPPTIARMLARFYGCLIEGGFLITGAAEYSREAYGDFEARVLPETVVYEKAPARRPAASPLPLPLILPQALPRPAARPTAPRIAKSAPELKREDDAVAQAIDLIARDEIDAALVLLAAAAEGNGKDARIPFLLGRLAADRQHLPDAAYWLGRALALDPLNLWAHYFMALLWIEEGRLADALAALKKTTYIDPNFVLGHFYLGRIHKAEGRSEQARKSFAVVKNLLSGAGASQDLSGADGISGRQLLVLVEQELAHE
ncbi:MAG TPA: CheR family methyltransferase [Candidatus Binatia bacterium]|nr:CheR family methyltransferase [Candidatus Binatia bacterium]